MKNKNEKEYAVKLSLPDLPFDTAAKITGEAAKEIAYLLSTVLRQKTKRSKGKSRLAEMIMSGEDLTAFSVSRDTVKLFAEQIKRYGFPFCILQNKYLKSNKSVFLIVKDNDAPKAQRIIDRLPLSTEKTENSAVQDKQEAKTEAAAKEPVKTPGQIIVEEALKQPEHQKEGGNIHENPFHAKTVKSPLLRRD